MLVLIMLLIKASLRIDIKICCEVQDMFLKKFEFGKLYYINDPKLFSNSYLVDSYDLNLNFIIKS